MDKQTVKQELFVLTRDMVPLRFTFSDEELKAVWFICPLPRGYKNVVTGKLETIKLETEKLVADINRRAQIAASPFENILLGYHKETLKQQKKYLQNFKITQVDIDERGVIGVCALGGGEIGDVNLDESGTNGWYDIGILQPLAYLFEPWVSFQCHNVVRYWQALLTREFCVEYFNLLNRLIFEKKSF